MLEFVNSVIEKMSPLWASDYFKIPVFFFAFFTCVLIVKQIIKGGSLNV